MEALIQHASQLAFRMLNWLRRRNAPARVAVVESLPVDGKRSLILVRRDNIEHLVMVGGRIFEWLSLEQHYTYDRNARKLGVAAQVFSDSALRAKMSTVRLRAIVT
jgi:hypothetical protein